EHKIALSYPDGTSISFSELDLLSNQMAHFLASENLKQGDVIAIFNEKSLKAYALMIGCIKTGIVYTNLDVSSPTARINKILNTCKPNALFIDESVEANAHILYDQTEIKTINISSIHIDHFSKEPVNYTDQNFHGNNPLYIMFTSGSTGFPKGAVMSHSNVLHFINWGKSTFSVTENDVFTNANPIYFDNSVFDFYVSLFNGATLVPLSHELVKKPVDLVAAINKCKCTIWFSVPSLLVYLLTTKALKADDFHNVSRIAFGGEGFPKNKLKSLYQLFGNRITLYNVYGPTECTCICSSYKITENDFEKMDELAPLGLMAPNFGYYINPQSPEDIHTGELCLTGPCVGLGYYNDPDRTNQSFVQQPDTLFHLRMYKTGDLVHRDSSGNFHFKGRVDNQIKHMGYRIELEEIEAALNSIELVDEAAVIYEKLSADLGQIKAFVCVNKEIAPTELSAQLKEILPPYMIPRSIKIIKSLPKNQNGKTDRNQLKELK
ncbi:MAG: amino acid adenylation domain-containing protein, partial [Bacteroidota bacterium]